MMAPDHYYHKESDEMVKSSVERQDEEEEEEEEGGGPTTTTTPLRKKQKRAIDDDANGDVNHHDDSVVEAKQEEENALSATLTDTEVLDCSICIEPLSPPVFQDVPVEMRFSNSPEDLETKYDIGTCEVDTEMNSSSDSIVHGMELITNESSSVGMDKDWTNTFEADIDFDSKEKLISWVKDIGKVNNMIVIIQRTDSSKGRSPRIQMACERHGSYKGKEIESSRNTKTKKCGCPFRLKGVCTGDVWRVNVICGRHNHALITSMEEHPYAGRLTLAERKKYMELAKSGVKPKQALAIIKQTNPNNCSTLQTLYNEKKKVLKKEIQDKNQMQLLMELTTENDYIVVNRRDGDTDAIINILWAHPDSISLLKSFPYVLIMDSAYKTIVFDFVLFEIVGITSTMKTFPICYCALMNEDTENFTWALERVKDMMDLQPLTIVTDQTLALMSAVDNVFPNSTHLLCRWHIKMDVNAKIWEFLPKEDGDKEKIIGGDLSLKGKKQQVEKFQVQKYSLKEECHEAWQNVVHASTIGEFEAQWLQMTTKYAEFPQLLNYIESTWLIYKEKFIAAWTDNAMHFGNTSTNMVESAHSSLKASINNNRRQNFLSMWSLIHNSLPCIFASIKSSFEFSINSVKHQHRIKILDNLRGNVSTAALELIKEEFVKVEKANSDGSNCSCVLRRCYGLPCAHEMKVAMEHRESKMLYLADIHAFWKKLSTKPSHIDLGDLEIHEEFANFVESYRNSAPDRKAFLLRSLKELGRLQTTWLTDPEVLDCSICMEPLSPPVFQCENGHIACSQCCTKLHNKCPSCSWPIGYNRCLAIEKVLESIKVSCGYKQYGCRETFSYMHKQTHEEKCICMPCLCPISSCDFRGSCKQISLHFSSEHRSSSTRFRYNCPFTVSFSKLETYLVFQEDNDGPLFVLSNQIEPIGSAIRVVCLDPSCSNGGFLCELVARKEDGTLRMQSPTKCVKEQCEASSAVDFLLVPYEFYCSSGKLKLEICIRRVGESDCMVYHS